MLGNHHQPENAKRQEPEAPRDPAPVIPPAEDSKKTTRDSSHGEATHPKTWEFGCYLHSLKILTAS